MTTLQESSKNFKERMAKTREYEIKRQRDLKKSIGDGYKHPQHDEYKKKRDERL